MVARGVAAVLVALAALVTACSTPVAGTPRPADAGGEAVGGGMRMPPEQQRLAALFAEVRTWDLCAMHDVAAAARATGFAPDELLPYLDLGLCRLVMQEPSGRSTWELQLTVFPMVPTPGGAPLEAGGATLQQVGDSSDERCAYGFPITAQGDEPWGIEVSAYSIADNRAPCDVVRDYAAAIVPRMAEPPLRSAGLTTPALDLAASDPCALAAAMVPAVAEGATIADAEVEDLAPFQCDVLVSTDVTKIPASVAFTVELAREVGDDTVAGFPATRSRLGTACEVVFAPFDTELTGNPGLEPSVPAVEVVGGCGQIAQLAEAAAGALAPPAAADSAPTGQPLALGDLDPPPTAGGTAAPFDPCTVVGWQAYPADVQPSIPREPVPMPVGPDDPFAVGCKFNAGEMFSSLVWGMPSGPFSADPAIRYNAEATRFGGLPGVEQVGKNDANGAPSCYSAVQLSRGIAAMSTTVPGDPCAVNRAVLEQVVREVR